VEVRADGLRQRLAGRDAVDRLVVVECLREPGIFVSARNASANSTSAPATSKGTPAASSRPAKARASYSVSERNPTISVGRSSLAIPASAAAG